MDDVFVTPPAFGVDEEQQKRFVEHVIIGAVRGIDGYGCGELLGKVADSASDDLLAHAAWYFWRDLSDAKDRDDREWAGRVWNVMDDYWRMRTLALRDHPGYCSEASSFAFWLPLIPVAPHDIRDRLSVLVDRMKHTHDLKNVISYLLTLAPKDVDISRQLALQITNRIANEEGFIWIPDNLEQLFERVLSDGGVVGRQAVSQAISDLLSKQQIDFRHLLDE